MDMKKIFENGAGGFVSRVLCNHETYSKTCSRKTVKKERKKKHKLFKAILEVLHITYRDDYWPYLLSKV